MTEQERDLAKILEGDGDSAFLSDLEVSGETEAVAKIQLAETKMAAAAQLKENAAQLEEEARELAAEAIERCGVKSIKVDGGSWTRYVHVSTTYPQQKFFHALLKRNVNAQAIADAREEAKTVKEKPKVARFSDRKEPKDA